MACALAFLPRIRTCFVLLCLLLTIAKQNEQEGNLLTVQCEPFLLENTLHTAIAAFRIELTFCLLVLGNRSSRITGAADPASRGALGGAGA
jgi:hypothetical protein